MFDLFKKSSQLKEEIQQQQNELDHIKRQILEKNCQLEEAKQEHRNLVGEIGKLQGIIDTNKGNITMFDIGLEPLVDRNAMVLTEAERKIAKIEAQINNLCSTNDHISIFRHFAVNNSDAKGTKVQKAICEGLISNFNAYFSKKLKAVTTENFTKSCSLISTKAERLNKTGDIVGVNISNQYLNLCLDLIDANLDLKITKAEEKERRREERERLREQEKFLAEAEKEKTEIQRQRLMYEQNLARVLDEQERLEFENKLKELDKREQSLKYRLDHPKAGYLYVTATEAMPGKTKVGATKRAKPLNRIREISSASVPYPFVCYGLVFSDDVFGLEAQVHNHLSELRVNKENPRKEFFYITPKQVIDILEQEFNCEVFCPTPEELDDQEDSDDE